jgi:DGQHR domain-containing protein
MNQTSPSTGAETGFIEIQVMEVNQPLGTFYVGVIAAKDLRRIAAADTRRQQNREVEVFTGIQRELNRTRREEIQQYIGSFDASFPNSFIIAVREEDILEQTDTFLRIKDHEKAASIIDGQHRLAGFTDLNQDNFQLIVAIFIELPIEDQAMLFATINLKQTKVNPSLVFDLFEETKLRSPQKTCHNISKALNTEKDSPLFHRIKPLGMKMEAYKATLTQASFVKGLLPHVCATPEQTRDDIKRKLPLRVDDPENQNCIFWKHFVEGKDWAILKVLTNYFGAVAEVFQDDWNSNSPLSRTIGLQALMRILPELFQIGANQGTLEKTFFKERFLRATALARFTFEQYPANGTGETRLVRDLREKMLP